MTPSCVRSNRTIPTKTKSPSMTGILFWRHRFSSQVPDWDLRFATRNRKNDARHPHRRQVHFGLFASQIRVFVFWGALRCANSHFNFGFLGLFAARIRVSTLIFSGSSLREFAFQLWVFRALRCANSHIELHTSIKNPPACGRGKSVSEF